MAIKIKEIKTVAVTGASGFIGQHLVKFLLGKGLKVNVLINQTDLELPVNKYYGSLADEAVLDNLLDNAEVLFHLASALGNRLIAAEEFFHINQKGTKSLMEAARKADIKKVIIFSSAGVYGQSSGLIPLNEEDHLNPKDDYERSKLAGERIALSCSETLDICVIRPGWVYGEGDRRVYKLIKQINSGIFFIAGKGRVKHSPIYVEDLIGMTWDMVVKGINGEIYNAGGDPLSVSDIVEMIADILGKKAKYIRVPMIMVYPFACLMGKIFSLFKREAPLTVAKLAFFLRGKPLDSNKIYSAFGLEQGTSFKDGMSRSIQWYKKENWL